MEKSFDFGALLRKNEKKHKSRPTQFVSVAGGIQKRLETNLKNRRSSRLTYFDRIRDLPRCESPDPVIEAQLKIDHRKMQLQKWKVEKEQKKKEAAAKKKKPFIAGVAHTPLNFVLPPPVPSTSGRVTRSQTQKNSTQSFAPKNASFQPPKLKNPIKLPSALSKTKKKVNNTLVFNPVLPNTVKQTRSRTVVNRQTATETKSNAHKTVENRKISTVKGKVVKKPTPKTYKVNKTVAQTSSSSSDVESKNMNIVKRIKTPGPGKGVEKAFTTTPRTLALSSESSSSTEKSAAENNGPSSSSSSEEPSNVNVIKRMKTPGKADAKESKTPRQLALSPEETTDTSNTRKSTTKSRKSLTSIPSSVSLSSDSSNISNDVDTTEQNTVIRNNIRKSLPRNFSPTVIIKPMKSSSENESYVTPNKSNRSRVPKSESSSEEKLRSPKSPVDLPLTPEQIEMAKISPCVTMSRGKANARKEMKWKMDEGMLDYDTSDIENVGHFRRQLASEIERMTGLCETWDKVSEQTVLPEPVQEAVLAAVGQARLLMSQKMQQFASLVERCARPEPGTALVTPADLHGFWDMLFMQVENIDMRFKKLEELRARNWAEDKPAEAKRRVARPAAARRPKPAASSRIRDMVAAARKAKKEQESSPTSANSNSSGSSLYTSGSQDSTKTFEAGFFSVRSPVRQSAAKTPSTPARNSLLKAVLSSEAKKASSSRNSASFAMLRASVMAKNAEYDGIAPLQQTPQMTPINLYATPGRSILKPINDKTTKSGKKSIKLVLFNESDNDIDSSLYQSDPASEAKEATEDPEPETEATEQLDLLIDSNAVMDVDKNTEQTDKENDPRPKLVRQDAVLSPSSDTIVRTRRQRKSMQTPKEIESGKTEGKTRATPNEPELDAIMLNPEKTPRRSTRKKKSVPVTEELKEKTTKRSTRSKLLKEVETNVIDEVKPTPKRSNRHRKSAPILALST